MYRYLSVDIPSSSCTVQECLETFFQPEDREIKCEKCKEGKVATQTLKVLQKPKAMLLHLKRFVLSTDNKMVIFRKNKAPVQLLETVDNDYKLHSVVHHIGNTASSGHYTADAVRQLEGKEQWVSFDDTHVKDTTLDKALKDRNKQTTSYMMLYTSS
jgi:ubiquitin C-terminal hydrolase